MANQTLEEPKPQTPDSSFDPDYEDVGVTNPLLDDAGNLTDLDEEAADRLLAASQGEDPPAPPKRPTETQDFQDEEDGEIPEELREPKAAQGAPKTESKGTGLDGLLSKEEKREKNKGLRSQVKDLSQAQQDLQDQIAQRDAELQALREEKQRIEEERETYQRGLSQHYEVGQYSPDSDEDVKKIDLQINRRLRESKMTLGPEHGQKLSAHWETLIERYNQAMNGDDSSAEKFHALLEANFDDRAPEVAREIAKLSGLIDQRGQTIQNNRTNFFKTHISGWEGKLNKTKETLAAIGSLDEEKAREELNGDGSANAVISYLAKQHPEFAKQLEDIKTRTAVTLAGPRPFDLRDERWQPYLDPNDPTRLSEEGQRIRQAEIFNHQRSQEILPAKLAEGMAAASLLPAMAKRIAELERRLGDDQAGEIEPSLDHGGDSGGQGRGITLTEKDLDDYEGVENPHLKEFL